MDPFFCPNGVWVRERFHCSIAWSVSSVSLQIRRWTERLDILHCQVLGRVAMGTVETGRLAVWW